MFVYVGNEYKKPSPLAGDKPPFLYLVFPSEKSGAASDGHLVSLLLLLLSVLILSIDRPYVVRYVH